MSRPRRPPVHNLYALRIAISLSVQQVAQRVGVCRSTYYRWEQGKSNPSPQQRRTLARFLRTTQTFLCQGE